MRTLNNNLIDVRFVDGLVHNLSGSAHVKDAATGKYVISNLANVFKLGMEKPEDIYGKTVWDLNLFMQPHWGGLAQNIDDYDRFICFTGKSVNDKNRVLMTPAGNLFVHTMKKMPIYNSRNQITSILTINDDITQTLDKLILWQFYRGFYSKEKHLAISHFLRHINILSYFETLPTEAELIVLITKAKTSPAKSIAAVLAVSTRTVETHLSRLRDKLKINLQQVLTYLNMS